MRIGILIPEFPGQTHIFFWREMEQMRRLGADPVTLSTRRPPAEIVSHAWSEPAMRATTYLFPPGGLALTRALTRVLAAGPGAWREMWTVIAGSATGLRARARLAGLALMGAHLAFEARRRDVDHVHVHSCADSAFVALFGHILTGLGYSLTLHGPLSLYGIGQKYKWGGARFAVLVTDTLLHETRELLPELDSQRWVVAPMGVDADAFSRSSPYVPPAEGEAWRLVSCGRLHVGKGHQDVIAAVERLAGQGRDVRLTVMGEGPHRPALERQIEEGGLGDRVILLGAVSEERVRAELEAAHAFVLGSHDEAIGVATMEAMAMELPVVVTDVGGVSELVRSPEVGTLVAAHQPAEFAAAVASALQDPEAARRRGVAARNVVVEEFGAARSAAAIVDRVREGADGVQVAR